MAWYRCGMNGTYRATTVSRSGAVCNYVANVGGVPLSRFIANITPIQAGSGDPSPINQRTITGWSAVNVARTGVNLADFTDGYGIATNGSVIVKEGRFATVNPIPINPDTSYYTQSSMSNLSFIISVYKGTTLVRRTAGISAGTLLDTSGGDKLYVCGYKSSDVTIADCNPMVKATTDTLAYAPYTGQTATINLGGTYYLATLNVLTGLFTVLGKYFVFNSAEYYGTYGYDDAPLFYVDITGEGIARMENTNYDIFLISNMLSKISTAATQRMRNCEIRTEANNAPSKLYFRIDGYTSKAAIDALLADNPLQVVAELATPVTYQLTPAQLTQLLGENNVWSDSGDSEVDFFKIIRT